MTSAQPTPLRMTVRTVAPTINGELAPAPQPMGTWMTRWAALYTTHRLLGE